MTPYYIFEDSEKSSLSTLLKYSYSELYESGHLLFANGNGGFMNILKEFDYEKDQDQTYVLFIDAIPDNSETEDTYNDLKMFIEGLELSDRFCVLPIICAEYYFIKAFHNTPIEKDPALVERCISLQVHYDDAHAIELDPRVRHRSLERYCKTVFAKGFHSCVEGHGRFLRGSCPCNQPDCGLELNWNIMDKTVRYVSSFPAAPAEIDLPELYNDFLFYTFDDLKKISIELCEAYNKKLNEYKKYCEEHNKVRKFGDGIKEV